MNAKSIIPTLSYKNATKAIDWLCATFGFKVKQLHQDGDTVMHAELVLGEAMIMVSSAKRGSPFEKQTIHPGETGRKITQSPYIVLYENEIEQHYKTAKEQGADIIYELKEEDYGGKNYSCYDLEGHLWHFGSYDPWNFGSDQSQL